jgi:hypothetical protein
MPLEYHQRAATRKAFSEEPHMGEGGLVCRWESRSCFVDVCRDEADVSDGGNVNKQRATGLEMPKQQPAWEMGLI